MDGGSAAGDLSRPPVPIHPAHPSSTPKTHIINHHVAPPSPPPRGDGGSATTTATIVVVVVVHHRVLPRDREIPCPIGTRRVPRVVSGMLPCRFRRIEHRARRREDPVRRRHVRGVPRTPATPRVGGSRGRSWPTTDAANDATAGGGGGGGMSWPRRLPRLLRRGGRRRRGTTRWHSTRYLPSNVRPSSPLALAPASTHHHRHRHHPLLLPPPPPPPPLWADATIHRPDDAICAPCC